MILAVLVMLSLAFQGGAIAGSVEGTVKSVDGAAKKLEVSTAEGASSWISYGDTTEWPAGVTDPSDLVGKKVSISTDDVTEEATSVAEAAE